MTPVLPPPGESTSRFERLLDRCPLWLLRVLSFLDLVKEREWLAVASRLAHTEWTEAPAQFPHCCTQGGCWAHTDVPMCKCGCLWCRLARRQGKDYPAGADWQARHAAHHGRPDAS
jgi:hypothetical protein